MSSEPRFKKASPYQDDVLALPVTDLDVASRWYRDHFGMAEVDRRNEPVPTVVLERDGVQIGFAVNGGDPTQDGAAVLVSEIQELRAELEAKGAKVGDWRVDQHDDGRKYQVFFVVAPDGLCYYFHEPMPDAT